MSKAISIEWRVDTDDTEDEYGTDEKAARYWAARYKAEGWGRVCLKSRTVVTETAPWLEVSA